MKKTIMVTGGTGYIGAHVVKKLLKKGHHVRLTVRDKNKTQKLQFLQEIADNSPGELEIFQADLLENGSFDEAAKGSDAIFHMASPFTLRFKDPLKELIEPAVQGTRNVLQAANKSGSVKKIVLTSSVAAVYGDNADMQEQGLAEFTEEHFNSSSSITHQPYSYSKVLAEKKAWEMESQQKQWKLVVINPAFVMGPPLGGFSKSGSLDFMKDMLKGKYFLGAPDLKFGFVDVQDVAQAHILALEKEEAHGRYILVERIMSMWDFSHIIRKQYPAKYRFKLPVMKSPKFMLYLVGPFFGLTFKFVKRNVGHPLRLSNEKSIRELGINYTPIEKSIGEMVDKLDPNPNSAPSKTI